MSATAVAPIARPMSARRSVGSASACRTGEFGYSTSAVNTPAEIMNIPSAQPSIRYSGQWLRSATRAPTSTTRLEARVQGHTAVHKKTDAVYVVCVIGGEPHGRAADLVSLADPLVRNELHQLTVSLRCIPRFHVDGRAYGSGADRVHPDAIGSHLLRDAFHHEHHTALGRRVIDMARPRNDFVHRADAENLAGRARNVGFDATASEFAHRFART